MLRGFFASRKQFQGADPDGFGRDIAYESLSHTDTEFLNSVKTQGLTLSDSDEMEYVHYYLLKKLMGLNLEFHSVHFSQRLDRNKFYGQLSEHMVVGCTSEEIVFCKMTMKGSETLRISHSSVLSKDQNRLIYNLNDGVGERVLQCDASEMGEGA